MKIIVFIFCSFLSLHFFSQQKILIDENFDSNHYSWKESSADSFATTIKNGNYILEVEDKIDPQWTNIKTGLDGNIENFTVEANLICTTKNSDMGFGLVIGMYNDYSDYKIFYITNTGYFKINHFYSKQHHAIQDWKLCDAIKKNEENKLTVKRDFNCVDFYINDKLVHTACEMVWWGPNFGFYLSQKQTVKISDLKITSSPKLVHPVENAIQGRKKENLGLNINSTTEELVPLVSYDGKKLFFSRIGHPENIQKSCDIWYSTLNDSGKWSKAKNIGTPLNNSGGNSVASISPDENNIIVSNTYKPNGEPLGRGLSRSRLTESGWEVPQAINIIGFKNVNKYQDNFMASDNKTLLLSVENEDCFGEKDIFVSFLQNDGSFSHPKNLGATVNTRGGDFGMSLGADGKTMYFNSYGHESYGSADVFITKRLDDSWTNWSKPVNLGQEINSEKWEGVFCIPANGEFAYLSSSDNSYGQADIFRIRMSKESRPEPVVLIHGKVLNKKTNAPISSKITYNDLKDNKEIGTALSNPSDGSYRIILPLGKIYSFLAEKTGFYSVSDNMDVTTLNEYKEIERNLYLAPLDEGAVILLNNIFFEFDKSDLKSESFSEIDRLLKILNDNPALKIEISGHSDDKGSDDYNKNLSQSRVNSVLTYLTGKGVAGTRLIAKGYGESKPIAANDTDENRAKNRRVEFVILKK